MPKPGFHPHTGQVGLEEQNTIALAGLNDSCSPNTQEVKAEGSQV